MRCRAFYERYAYLYQNTQKHAQRAKYGRFQTLLKGVFTEELDEANEYSGLAYYNADSK